TFVLSGTPYAELSGPGEAEFRMLAVDPAAQGRGAGAALVDACLARAAELGCSAVVICVRSGMAASAHRLYQRLGFVRIPEKDWSPLPGVDLLGLRLDLTARG
ncbi:MAG TPA: GNAT family N-acetyltransferase, partial [Streptosporangiaceae bacterium]